MLLALPGSALMFTHAAIDWAAFAAGNCETVRAIRLAPVGEYRRLPPCQGPAQCSMVASTAFALRRRNTASRVAGRSVSLW